MKKAIFCVPGAVYKGLPEEEVATRYTRMASHEFDELIGFEPEYASKFLDKPDYSHEFSHKGNKQIIFSAFAGQPVVRVGKRPVKLTSTSNLYNPECNLKAADGSPLYLPDLEIIQVSGPDSDVTFMEDTIKELYAGGNGWTVNAIEDNLLKATLVNFSPRRDSLLEIINPWHGALVAGGVVGYSHSDLCF